jgi:hypothetical protein
MLEQKVMGKALGQILLRANLPKQIIRATVDRTSL